MLIEFKSDKLSVNLIDEGDGDCIVLLHGWGAYAEVYLSIINVLKPHFRVIAPDFPGFGKTDEPSFAYKTSDYSDFVLCLLEKLGIQKASFIGHSHGGRTILELASRQNLPVIIEKIVLIDSAGLPVKTSPKVKAKTLTYKALKKLALTRLALKVCPDGVEKLRKKFGSADYSNSSSLLRESMVKVISEDFTENLKHIKVPTLLIWGDKDTATPIQNAKLMEKEIQNCGLVTIKNAGHFSFVSDMPLVSRVLKSFFKF